MSPEYFMTLWLLIEHHLEFLKLKRSYTGLSESTLVKMANVDESISNFRVAGWYFSFLFNF